MNCKSLNIKGMIMPLDTPVIMGILNVTPDSFFLGSRKKTEKEIDERVQEILSGGGTIIDLGGYSSRPDAAFVDEQEEMKRLTVALELLNRYYPDAILSVDTFRSEIARRCVEDYGVAVVNDISGGELDPKMFETVARLQVPYILMHMKGTPQTMQQHTDYTDLIGEMQLYFASRVRKLHLLGVNDIILDPGFGFSKTVDQNYRLMRHLKDFALLNLPLLVGISRKSMIYKFLETTPEESLNGTTVLNTIALLNGADILRVHDVKEAVEVVCLVTNYSKAD
ncbi:MAG: dihydropteroate synthase [Massilibacteroides sp.]|nr:dihydropteroate synthase [Massilibacteroides sp.]MDD3062164.1 dihydropteroate synthase [Massilibacteroides sp.]MDD4114851.1 dihydropteroate synthase [Massilibacteroides sp.]MDD4660877.1 dihydropteroate synthase [Massilibacteroides sp.]